MTSIVKSLRDLADNETYDVAVVGAGGAGMAAALFAALRGQRVLLIESTGYVGGTSAFSGGTTWIPNSLHSHRIGAGDSREKASRFLDLAVSERASKAMRESFSMPVPRRFAPCTDTQATSPAAYIPGSTVLAESITTCPYLLVGIPPIA